MLASGRVEEVTGLREAFPGALLPGPLGPLTPDTAVLLPLTVSGRPDPIGVLVVGVNPYRPLNPEYRAFLTVVARQVRVALGDTVAYEVERLPVAGVGRPGPGEDGVLPERQPRAAHPADGAAGAAAESARRRPADRPEAERQDLQAAVRAAERLRTMVDALLDFSGAEARTLNPDRQPTDLADLTAQTCSMFRAAAEHAGLAFHVEVPDAPMTVAVDRAMWSTIVTNLVSNAVKYTHPRECPDPAHRAPTTDAVLTVADTGAGIATDQQPLVFDRFYRATDGHGTGRRDRAGGGGRPGPRPPRAHGPGQHPGPGQHLHRHRADRRRWPSTTRAPISRAGTDAADSGRPGTGPDRTGGAAGRRVCWSRTTPICGNS